MLEANPSNRVTSFGYQMGKYAIGGRGSQRCDTVSYRLIYVFLVSRGGKTYIGQLQRNLSEKSCSIMFRSSCFVLMSGKDSAIK